MDRLDLTQPNIARVYDYLLGGTANFPADREVGDRIIAGLPQVQIGVKAQRAVLGRVVRYLVGEVGLRQLIDIGSGLPTAESVHEIAHRIDPLTRVVYVDTDPVVLAQAGSLLEAEPAAIIIDGDLRLPAGITGHPAVRRHLDLAQPVGLLLCGILHYLLDEERPAEVLAALTGALAPGSYVFIHHLLDAGDPAIAAVQEAFQRGLGRGQFRTWEQIGELFTGLELVEPGLVLVPEWRPDADTPSAADQPVLRLACAGVARKP